MAGNSLQAMLNRAKAQDEVAPVTASEPKPARSPRAQRSQAKPEPKPKTVRGGTRLIGGHFPPEVANQLRIVAAEEATTIQNLLAEALDDLFVKKGKARIALAGRSSRRK